MSNNPIFLYWWYHFPNLALAALMYTLLGRFILGFFFDPSSQNYIWRAFVFLTDPVVKAVGYVTPHAVPHPFVLLFAVVWIFAARVVLFVLFSALGIAPTIGGQPS